MYIGRIADMIFVEMFTLANFEPVMFSQKSIIHLCQQEHRGI